MSYILISQVNKIRNPQDYAARRHESVALNPGTYAVITLAWVCPWSLFANFKCISTDVKCYTNPSIMRWNCLRYVLYLFPGEQIM